MSVITRTVGPFVPSKPLLRSSTALIRPPPARSSTTPLTAMPPKRKSATKAEGGDADATTSELPKATKKVKSALEVGDNVSTVLAELPLQTEEGETVTLAEIVAKSGAVIFMYPKANTSGCTKQACSFGENYSELQDLGYDVYGLSFDKPTSQKNWQTKYSLPYHLLTDSDGTVLKAFGAFKPPRNITRSHVVIAKGGELIDIRNGISSGDSFAEALKTVQAAAGGK